MLASLTSTVFVACLGLTCLARGQFTELLAPQGMPTVYWSNTTYGSGQAILDFDGDGDMDAVVAPMAGLPIRLFRNDGNLSFTDISAGSGLGWHLMPHAVEAADVDNDGDPDIYIGGGHVPGRLYINDGNGVFSEEATARGLAHSDDNYSASFGDFDRDGWLDLYLGNRFAANGVSPGANRLYRNTGGGHFVDVTATSGCSGNSLTLACAFFDYNEDGWPDLFEVSEKGWHIPNELYRNNGDGTFTPVAAAVNANIAINGMGIDFVDAFNDGGLDFYCTDGPPDHLFQTWDPALQAYTVATSTYGLEGGGIGWSCNFFDYNNDGWQDLYVVQEVAPNLLFENPGTAASAMTPWPEKAMSMGCDQAHSQYMASTVDFDDDGRVDLLQRFHQGNLAANGLILYRNTSPAKNWLKFRTEGRRSNRDGIGARVVVHSGYLSQRQYVRSGCGYLGGSDPRLHFGLDNAALADLVEVTWPSGQNQYLTNVAANQVIHLVEPTITSTGAAPVGGASTVTASIPGDEGLPYLLALSLSANHGIPLGNGNILPIDFDALTQVTLDPTNAIFTGSVGVIDANGNASATLNVPPLPFLSGLQVFCSGLTTDTAPFSGARTVLSEALVITIQ
jgi:enediyne biosynthesis protein E4